MKKTISAGLIVMLTLVSINNALGQQVVATSGNHYSNSYGSISWTLGELAIETISNADVTLTQGFHQTRLGTTGLDLLPGIQADITTYPNPAGDRVNIRINGLAEINGWNYIMYDQSGRVILKDKINSDVTEVPVNGLVEAVYYLRVYSGPESARVFKIVKQ